jgi:alpha-beta hydrolase superfamily lysophospholipase
VFSTADAIRLRDQLPLMDIGVAVSDDTLSQRYIEHYGLRFGSKKLPVAHSLGYFPSQGFRLACQYFAPPLTRQTGTAIVVHGYYDHSGLFNHLIRECLGLNLAVLIFDLPGHGLSTGEVASIDAFDQYSMALLDCLHMAGTQNVHQPWFLIGQSTGAAAIANYLQQEKPATAYSFEKIVLLAPLLRPSNWTQGRLMYYLLHLFVKRWQRVYADNSHDVEFLRFIREYDPLQSAVIRVEWVRALINFGRKFETAKSLALPLHIIQGTDDTTVDWRYNLPRYAEKFSGSKTYFIPKARHHLVNESAEIRAEIFSVLKNILQA